MAKKYFCDFCGKREDEVEVLIAERDRCICNECIDMCNDIIAEIRGNRLHKISRKDLTKNESTPDGRGSLPSDQDQSGKRK